MYKSALVILGLVASTFATPVDQVEELHIVHVKKRQADVSQLLQLATLAGITSFPTDPAFLLALGPEASSLAAALPTPSVLSVLVTAAPSGFVSSIVNDPSFASAFESSFSAGHSPSWFNALPTGVKSYLHTYTGFANIAGAAAGIKGSASNATMSGSTGSRMMTTTSGGSSSSGSSMMSSSMTSSMAGGASSAAAGSPSSSSSHGGASRPTGVIAAGLVGVVGFLGVAVAL